MSDRVAPGPALVGRNDDRGAAAEWPQIRLVTSAQFPELSIDDQLLLTELTARGLRAEPAVWTDPTVDWSRCPVTVLRSTWDYHLRKDEFLAWCQQVQAVSNLQNPLGLVQNNAHKGYLAGLAESGLPVVETVQVARGEHQDLAQTAAGRGWAAVLVKPAVSAAAHGTRHAPISALAGLQQHLDMLLLDGDALVQPYLPEIAQNGELSYFFIGGEFSHAVRRASALAHGVQAAHQGQLHQVREDEQRLAERVLASVSRTPLYARVDLVRTRTDRLALLELELIEPALYLRHAPTPCDTSLTTSSTWPRLTHPLQTSRRRRTAYRCAVSGGAEPQPPGQAPSRSLSLLQREQAHRDRVGQLGARGTGQRLEQACQLDPPGRRQPPYASAASWSISASSSVVLRPQTRSAARCQVRSSQARVLLLPGVDLAASGSATRRSPSRWCRSTASSPPRFPCRQLTCGCRWT